MASVFGPEDCTKGERIVQSRLWSSPRVLENSFLAPLIPQPSQPPELRPKIENISHGPLQGFPCSSGTGKRKKKRWRRRPHRPPMDPLLLPPPFRPDQGASATPSALTTRSGRPKKRSSAAAGPARRCSTRACRGGRSPASTPGPGPGTASYLTFLIFLLQPHLAVVAEARCRDWSLSPTRATSSPPAPLMR